MTGNPTEATREGVVRLNVEAFMSLGCPDWKQVADPNGPFVYYSDYDALRSEVSWLRDEVKKWQSLYASMTLVSDVQQRRIDRMEAKLTKDPTP